MSDEGEVIRASDVGQYAYCARAWWLQRVQGVASQNVEQMAAGLESHAAHGRALLWAERQQRLAFALLALAMIGTAVLLKVVVGG